MTLSVVQWTTKTVVGTAELVVKDRVGSADHLRVDSSHGGLKRRRCDALAMAINP
jgi:hypothetical protein